MRFNLTQYAQNEIKLGLQLLEMNPNDIKQKDRIAYWAIKTGDKKLAKKYSVSPKLKGMFDKWVQKKG